MNTANDRGLGLGFTLFLGVVGVAIGLFVVALSVDISMTPLDLDAISDAAIDGGLATSMGALAEVLAAVLGLSLTVVAIVVQLASQRYPAKIVDLFMYEGVNIGTFGFMAASCIYVVLVPVVVGDGSMPVVAAVVALVLTVVNFGILLPYFGHVFAFLEPTNLISQIERRTRADLNDVLQEEEEIRVAQTRVAVDLERIADNCMAAVSSSDRNLALHSVRTLEQLLVHYLDIKEQLPEEWAKVEWDFFGTLAQEFVDEIVDHGTWLEAKGFMEFERIHRRSLEHMTEVISQLARSSRVLGEKAIEEDEMDVVELSVRFFNTYIRHALNHGNVRAVYNILYEYRRLALTIFDANTELGVRVVEHLVYYGRLANGMRLPFVTVTVAHDVRVLCEAAFDHENVDVEALLELFLSLDQQSEAKSEEVALMGVRKAQSILGAFFLDNDAVDLADRIRGDMKNEKRVRLESIRDQILSVTERKFWEITDRGHNFDYVEPELRPQIRRFFEPMVEKKSA